jgi:putative transposase
MIVTDLLRSYPAAMKIIGKAERQETGLWLNNQAENSHQPFQRRDRAITKLRSMKWLQKFTSIQSSVHNHFNQKRHLQSQPIGHPCRMASNCRLRSALYSFL